MDQATDTRQTLVMTAMRLFGDKGYGSTSVADILREADVNSGSLYHFFPGKQDLLLAVLETYSEGIEDMLLVPAWRDVDDPIERIFALLGKYRELLAQSDFAYGCPIGSLALELHEPDPAVRARLVDNFDAWQQAIRFCLHQAGDRLQNGADTEALATFVLTTMEGAVMLARTYRNSEAFDRAVTELRRYIDTLIAPIKDT